MASDVLGARVPVVYYTEAMSVPSGETLATITGVNRGGTVTTSQLTVTTGKVLRINTIMASGTILGTTVTSTAIRLRANPTGAATVTSPIYWTSRWGNISIGTQAAAYGLEAQVVPLAEGLEFPGGAGLQFTVNAATASMHSINLCLIGFEYTP